MSVPRWVMCSCGDCCNAWNEYMLCDKCLRNTLNANGLQEVPIGELKGLAGYARGYADDSGTDYSPLGIKLQEIIARREKEAK